MFAPFAGAYAGPAVTWAQNPCNFVRLDNESFHHTAEQTDMHLRQLPNEAAREIRSKHPPKLQKGFRRRGPVNCETPACSSGSSRVNRSPGFREQVAIARKRCQVSGAIEILPVDPILRDSGSAARAVHIGKVRRTGCFVLL